MKICSQSFELWNNTSTSIGLLLDHHHSDLNCGNPDSPVFVHSPPAADPGPVRLSAGRRSAHQDHAGIRTPGGALPVRQHLHLVRYQVGIPVRQHLHLLWYQVEIPVRQHLHLLWYQVGIPLRQYLQLVRL